MSQAKRRGTYEERVQQAILRKAHEEAIIQNQKFDRARQELQAWKTMVWWQIEMTKERYDRFVRRKHKSTMTALTLASAFGTFMYHPRSRAGFGRI